MKFTVSLKRDRDFRRLYAKGKSAASPLLVLYCRRTGRDASRLGVTVGKKVGKAVRRNKIRRRLKEAYRIHEGLFLPGFDLVAVARVRAAEASYREIEADLLRLSKRLGLLRDRP